ncbi:hypothetical protein [Singulisphaera acidiphila]|uniref:Uncharacterized protein n=1 Tax=Singulisphaera acidiphila (strain ATCC BAA-1392 / DSM 18658 / VKM B-2454 / MOB10) TaxID=886293 RepID=L0DRN3_SINAD|nr:hypothetical protein [Singulisphaera acidiphila]AGA31642.1 hypothetical protein Sinac_7611 [Singulisphaera acidiphila DSM 18658]
MRLVRLGRRWIINLDARPSMPGDTIRLKGDDAERFWEALEQLVEPQPWHPIKTGQPHPRGPQGFDR